MGKERLFELIREEDVVLFVGAGFSLYADYPSGAKLAEIIYNKLTKEEQEEIDFTYDLPKLTEDIYHLKKQNSNFILSCIKEVFSAPPKNIITHQLLGKIPQFRTIITTNYDSLIETCNNDLEVVRKSRDIPMINRNRPVLYKIHGDLNNLDEIILKTSDYENYFIKDKEQTIFWNQIKSALARHHILFIGYSLEDSNIRTIIEKIYKELGDLKKEAFFISPSVKKAKKSFLDSKGIQYIESTGEEFINELTEDLRLNYFPHILSKGGSADTALLFGEKYDLTVKLEKDFGKRNLILNDLIPTNKSGLSQTKVIFTTIPEKGLKQKVEDILNHRSLSLKIENSQLENLSIFLNNLRIQSLENVKSVEIMLLPVFNKKVSLVFDDGYETSEFQLKINGFKNEENNIVNEFEIFDFKIIVITTITENKGFTFNITIEPARPISNLRKAIEFYEIVNRISNVINFKIYEKEKLINQPIDFSLAKFIDEGNKKLNEDSLTYFKSLKEIEKFFKIRFSEINLNEMDFNKVEMVRSSLNRDLIPIKAQEHSFEFKEDNKNIKDTYSEKKVSILNVDGNRKTLKIHGQSIDLGYQFLFIPVALIKFISFNNETLIWEGLIKSEDEIDFIGFSETPDVTMEEMKINFEKAKVIKENYDKNFK